MLPKGEGNRCGRPTALVPVSEDEMPGHKPHLLESAPVIIQIPVFPILGLKTHTLTEHPFISIENFF